MSNLLATTFEKQVWFQRNGKLSTIEHHHELIEKTLIVREVCRILDIDRIKGNVIHLTFTLVMYS